MNFDGLADYLLGHSGSLLTSWLPGGRQKGKEYCCGSLHGEKGDSLKVNMATGVWADFATDDRGGDLISLYAAINSLGQGDAFKKLSDEFDFEQDGTHVKRLPEPPKEEATAPPKGTIPTKEDFEHREWGYPSAYWRYNDIEGDLLYCVARYETDKGKQILPWRWGSRGFWICKGWPAPRPLYGLELLAKHPNRKIMIVEGEKCADAARQICGHIYNVLSFPNGIKALHKADWSPIRDIETVLWPDNDDPGIKGFYDLASLLKNQGCSVKSISPNGKPEHWDAADALAEGWTWEALKRWAKDGRTTQFEPPSNIVDAHAIQPAPVANFNFFPHDENGAVTISHREIWDELNLNMTATTNIPLVNYDNVVRTLHGWKPFKGVMWYDEFHDKIFTTAGGSLREWSDNDDAELTVYFQRELGMARMSKECVKTGVTMYAKRNTKNEVKDWMETLKWDGEDRIGAFFHTYFGADDNVYTRQAGHNFWVGMIARVYLPGCKNDNMVVLEGKQGTGKSRSMELIGGPWYAEASESVQSKDFYMVFRGKILIEIAELDSFGKADVTRIKQTISCPKDTYRAPYDARPKDHPRHSIFVGTTNEYAYLRDTTGGRRFWPIACRRIKMKAIERDREQFFAQAVHYFKDGDEWYLMPVAETIAEQHNRLHHDSWTDAIETYVQHRLVVTPSEIATEVLNIDLGRFDKLLQMRVTNILRALGWKNVRKYADGKQRRIWERDTDED